MSAPTSLEIEKAIERLNKTHAAVMAARAAGRGKLNIARPHLDPQYMVAHRERRAAIDAVIDAIIKKQDKG